MQFIVVQLTMKLRRWPAFASALAIVLASGWAAVSRAEDATHTSEYASIVRAAVSEYNARNWVEALALFKQAHALSPNARTLRGIGNTAFELRRYAESLAALRAALVDQRKPLTDAERAEVRGSIERIEHYVGTLQITLDPELASAIVTLDGVTVTGRTFETDVGEHRVTIHADGYRDVDTVMAVDGGGTQHLTIALVPSSGPAEAASLQPKPRETATSGASSSNHIAGGTPAWLPWLVVGASGAVAVTGAVLFAIGRSDAATVTDVQTGTRWKSIQPAYDRAPVLSTAGAIALGVGLAGVAAGLYWQIALGHERETARSSARRDLRLRLSPTGLSLDAAL